MPDPHCPRCGSTAPLGVHGVCALCAAAEGFDPPCEACKLEGRGVDPDGARHVPTCAVSAELAVSGSPCEQCRRVLAARAGPMEVVAFHHINGTTKTARFAAPHIAAQMMREGEVITLYDERGAVTGFAHLGASGIVVVGGAAIDQYLHEETP